MPDLESAGAAATDLRVEDHRNLTCCQALIMVWKHCLTGLRIRKLKR